MGAGKRSVESWSGILVEPGSRRDVDLVVSQSYSGASVRIPIHVWRSGSPGPTVFVAGAVHGDEINGTGAIRDIVLNPPFDLLNGAIIFAPVINIFGFERGARYLPDRRDLNRCFPGSSGGSMASRLARVVYRELVGRSDFGLDLHSAAVRRTNFPNVRGDMDDPGVAKLARAFGTELILHGKGPKGSLRRAATQGGCPTIILEAGEVWKVEPSVVQYIQRGLKNVFVALGMVEGRVKTPPYQVVTRRTTWVRAQRGGFLQFHVAPGEIVEKGQPVSTNTSLLGREHNVLEAPEDGIVLGMTTLPAVAPGDPVCHLAIPEDGVSAVRAALAGLSRKSLHERTRVDLSTNLLITDPGAEPSSEPDPGARPAGA